MATPAIRVVNPNAPEGRQQAMLLPTNKARAYRERRMTFPLPPAQLQDESTALAHAEMLLHTDGIPAPSRQQCLGKLVVPFGQYLHAPFLWLVENDVGYLKYLVDNHRADLFNPLAKGKVHTQWIKDCLAEYAESFSQVSIVLEANVHQCVYGQKEFENHTFQEMWEIYCQYSTQKAMPDDLSSGQRDLIQKAYSSVCRWLYTPVTHITSVQMKRFRKFIYDKKKEQESSSVTKDPFWLNDTNLLEEIRSDESPSTVAPLSTCPSTVSMKTSPSTVTSEMSPSTVVTSKTPQYTVAPSITSAFTLTSKMSLSNKSVSKLKNRSHVTSAESSPSDSPVELEGWVHLWENSNGIPSVDLSWVKDDTERGIFTPIQVYHNNTGAFKRRRLMKSDRMCFYPPEPAGVLPQPDYSQMRVYGHFPSTAGTELLKERTDIVMAIPKSALMPCLPPPARRTLDSSTITKTLPAVTNKMQVIPSTSTITKPLPTIMATQVNPTTSTNTKPVTMCSSQIDTSSHSAGNPSVWARATLYKRKHTENLADVGANLSRVHNLPVCTLCNQPTQGHKKYKKKSFCPVKIMSTSKGFDNRVYTSYEHFMSVVDTQ